MARKTTRRTTPPESGASDEFARMLDEEGQGRFAPVAAGDRVEGTVVAITASSVLVDIGQRSEGVVQLDQVRPEDLGRLRVGDRGEFLVSRVSGGGIELAWALSAHTLDLTRLMEAKNAGIPVEGKVSGENKGGFTVELGGVRGFVPFSQLELGPSKPSEEYLGRTFRFRVLEVRGRDVVLSRGALLREEQARERVELLDRLTEGPEMEAEVVRVERFGVFVDVGAGLHALVPTVELAWSAQDEVKSVLEPGALVFVKIIDVDLSGPKPKIAASMRQVTDDPWSTASSRFSVGQVVRGRVTRLAPFGAFIELAPGIEGLLHVSEMSTSRTVRTPSEVVREGDAVEVAITAVDAAARRISLSIGAVADAAVDPELRARYMDGGSKGGGGGALADALRRALQEKK